MAEVSGLGTLIVGAPVASMLTVRAVEEGAVHCNPLQSQAVVYIVRARVDAEFPVFDVHESRVVVTLKVKLTGDETCVGY